jgi:hypothetical protein
MKLRWDSRIAAEVVLVFIGILVAFTLDSWWADRGQREREIAILKGVQTEFNFAAENIEQLIARHEKSKENFVELHRLLQSGEGIGLPERVIELSQSLWTANIYDAMMPAYQSLLDSVGLDFIRSEEFRQALIAYEIAAGRNDGWDRFLIGFDQDLGLSVLLSRLPYLVAVFEDASLEAEFVPDIKELAADLEFRNLIAVRASGEHSLLRSRKLLLEAVREVQRTISIEIGE